jgi:2,4-dienoyl-CoA reductase (NADPH2)
MFDPVLLCSVNPELAPPGSSRRPAAPLVVQHGGAGERGSVAIVGAGPAGLECGTSLAALTDVVVFDEHGSLGGQLAIAAAAPHRHGWRALLDYYESALDAAPGVTLRLGARVSAPELDGFEEIVIAIGSDEVLPSVPGIERALPASRAIGAGVACIADGSELLIVDDGFGSWLCASAVELGVSAGAARITVATPGAAFGAGLPPEGRVQLLARLRGAPLDVRPLTALETITDIGAELRGVISQRTETIVADAVIVVGERRARDWTALVPATATVRVIGDAVVPRRVAHAVSEGRAAAEAIIRARARDELKAPA